MIYELKVVEFIVHLAFFNPINDDVGVVVWHADMAAITQTSYIKYFKCCLLLYGAS